MNDTVKMNIVEIIDKLKEMNHNPSLALVEYRNDETGHSFQRTYGPEDTVPETIGNANAAYLLAHISKNEEVVIAFEGNNYRPEKELGDELRKVLDETIGLLRVDDLEFKQPPSAQAFY